MQPPLCTSSVHPLPHEIPPHAAPLSSLHCCVCPPPDPDTDDLYAMDETQLVGDKSPLEEPPDDAPGPPLHAASPFSLLAAHRPAPPLLPSPGSPPPLHGMWSTFMVWGGGGWCPYGGGGLLWEE